MPEDEKEKKSIDDILSDLNNLLNRMPQILEGIKLPDMKPIDFDQMAINDIKKEEEAPVAADTAAEQEKTLVYKAPAEPPVQAPERAVEPVFEREPAAQPQDLSVTPAPEKSESVQPEVMPTEELPAEMKEPEFKTENDDSFVQLADIAESETAAAPAETGTEPFAEPAAESVNKVLENTNDFGAPDIEALLKLAGTDSPEPHAPERSEATQTDSTDKTVTMAGTEPLGPQVPACPLGAARETVTTAETKKDDGGAMSEEKKEDLGGNGQDEIKLYLSDTLQEGEAKKEEVQEPAAEPAPSAEEEKTVIFNVEDLILDNNREQAQAGQNQEPAPEPREAAVQPEELPAGEPAGQSVDGSEKTVVFNVEEPAAGDSGEQPGSEPFQGFSSQSEETPLEQPVPEEPLQVPASQPEEAQAGQSVSEDSLQPVSAQPEPAAEPPSDGRNSASGAGGYADGPNLGISIGDESAEPNLQIGIPSGAAAANESEEEKTLFVAPSAGDAGEATVVFTNSQAAPSETSRNAVSEGDLQALIDKLPPENVLPERIKQVGFIYSSDVSSIFNVINSLDEICLASGEKPMFAKRAFVLPFAPEMSANYLTQRVSETGAVALIVVGEFPQEKLYEFETVFNTAGVLFRSLNPAEFSKGSAIDIVMELVLK